MCNQNILFFKNNGRKRDSTAAAATTFNKWSRRWKLLAGVNGVDCGNDESERDRERARWQSVPTYEYIYSQTHTLSHRHPKASTNVCQNCVFFLKDLLISLFWFIFISIRIVLLKHELINSDEDARKLHTNTKWQHALAANRFQALTTKQFSYTQKKKTYANAHVCNNTEHKHTPKTIMKNEWK